MEHLVLLRLHRSHGRFFLDRKGRLRISSGLGVGVRVIVLVLILSIDVESGCTWQGTQPESS